MNSKIKKISVICPYCNNLCSFVSGDYIYPHRTDLKVLNFYLCVRCNAYVGTHKKNKKLGLSGIEPLGTPANSTLRALRSKCHVQFDCSWKKGTCSRTEAYSWLAKKLGLHSEHCHIALFDENTCNTVLDITKDLLFLSDIKSSL